MAYAAHKRGDDDTAFVAVEAALELDPSSVDALYLDATLALQPDHGWARYIRALALLRHGDPAAAEDDLVALVTGGDADVAAEAGSALKDIYRATRHTEMAAAGLSVATDAPSKRLAGSWRFGTGLDIDTNPAYVPESSYVPTGETAVAVAAQVRGEQPLLRRGGTTIFLGPRGLVRAYPTGPSEYDLAQVTARLDLNQHGRKLTGWGGGGGGVSFLGWKPFLDIEELYLGGAWRQARWTSSRLALSGFRRGSHLEDYQNLDAWGWHIALSQRLQPAPVFRAEIGYAVRGEKAQGYDV